MTKEEKLIDSFRRSILNNDSIHSVKLGNELLHRNKKEFRDVTGPLCGKDKIELSCKKTFFGTYSYSCHHCESKYKSKYNKYTLEHNAKEFFRRKFT